MAHLDEVIVKVDDTLAEGVIAHMNELLIALSDDAQLSREERYIQQQRLRTAIAHHGRQHQEEQDARREQLTKGGAILRQDLYTRYGAGGRTSGHCHGILHRQPSCRQTGAFCKRRAAFHLRRHVWGRRKETKGFGA